MKRTKKWMIAAGVVLLLLLTAAAALYAGANHYLNKMNKVEDDPSQVVAPIDEDFESSGSDGSDGGGGSGGENTDSIQLDPSDVSWAEAGSLDDDHLINILLVGQDRRPGQGRQRSDSMILCSLNKETGKVSVISFLRDLYVQIPGGYSDNRLNAAYAFGGFPLLTKTLNKNFGVTVDGCFEVDFTGFTEIIDTIGGVDIQLTADEAAIVGKEAVAGDNHLTGEQALTYSRIRYLDSDFGRTNRQRTVLLAVYQQVKNSGTQELLNLMNTLLPMLTTDMSNNEILSLAMQVLPMFNSLSISTYHVPVSGSYHGARVRGMAVLVPDLPEIRSLLKNEYLPLN